jgi:hypothetical protein
MGYRMAHGALLHIGRNYGYLSKAGSYFCQRGNARAINAIIISYQYSHRFDLKSQISNYKIQIKSKIQISNPVKRDWSLKLRFGFSYLVLGF